MAGAVGTVAGGEVVSADLWRQRGVWGVGGGVRVGGGLHRL